MRKFLINLAYIVIFLLVVNAILYEIVEDYYNNYQRKMNNQFEVVLLADSHGAALGNSPEKIGIFNFSEPSENYIDMNRKINYMITNQGVKKILISVDDHSLSQYREKMHNNDRSIFYCEPFMSIGHFFKENILWNRYLKRYLVLLNIKSRDLIIAKARSLVLKQHRMETNWSKLSNDLKEKKVDDRFRFQFTQKKSYKLESILIEIIDTCYKHNVELIGIKFPLSDSFSKKIADSSYGADSVFKANNLRVLDFRDVFSNHDDYFYDQDHLNIDGCDSIINILERHLLN